MFRVVSPPIISSTYNCIYGIWHLSNRIYYLPLSWRRWNSVAVTVWQVPDAVDTVVCAPDDGWRYIPKHVEHFPEINKPCNVASCWIYITIYLRCTDPWTSNLHQLWFLDLTDSRPWKPAVSSGTAEIPRLLRNIRSRIFVPKYIW